MDQTDADVIVHGQAGVLGDAFGLGQAGQSAEGAEYGGEDGLAAQGEAHGFRSADPDGHLIQPQQQGSDKRVQDGDFLNTYR